MRAVNRFTNITGILLLFAVCITAPAFGQIGNGSGTSSGEILNLEIGSRATALGGAFIAFSDDATATFWNPSGLSAIESTEFQFGYSNWYQDISINYFGAAIPISDRFTSGVGLTYVDLGSFQGYSSEDIPTGEFGGHNMVLSLSMGFQANSWLSLGITAKGITEKLEESSASGLAFDIGTRVTSGLLSFGLAARNIGSGLKYEYDREPLPTHLDAGVGLRAFERRFGFAADINIPKDGAISLHQGMEYAYLNTIILRGGYTHSFGSPNGGGNNGMVYGFGLRIMAGSIDYSFIPDSDLGGIHKLDFSFKLNK